MADTYTIPLALLDITPNIMFLLGILFLGKMMNQLKNNTSKTLVFIGGGIVFCGGLLKATWKLILAASGEDITILEKYLFVFQAFGFTLLFAGILHNERNLVMIKNEMIKMTPLILLAPWEMPFMIITILFCLGSQGILVNRAFKRKIRISGYLFIASVLCTFGMSGIGSSSNLTIGLQWVAECINLTGQTCFATAAYFLQKSFIDDQKN